MKHVLVLLQDALHQFLTDVLALSESDALVKAFGEDGLDASKVADFMGSPTELVTEELYPLNAYGSAMAPLFNLAKNPVWFHIYPSVDNQANYTITNNTFRNFENLFRAYEFDRIEDYSAFTFEDNTLYNINYLVNYSGGSRFASKFGEIVKAGSLSLVPGLNGYSNESRDVLEMNTALGKDTTDGAMAERYIGTVAEYYTDLDLEDQIARFTYQVKNTVDAENCYAYIGKSGSHYFAQKQADGTIKYWSGKVSYSADGKDNVTLTEVTRDAVESAFGIA